LVRVKRCFFIAALLVVHIFAEARAQENAASAGSNSAQATNLATEVVIGTWGMVGGAIGTGAAALLVYSPVALLAPLAVPIGATLGVSLSAERLGLRAARSSVFLGAVLGTGTAAVWFFGSDDDRTWPIFIVLPGAGAWVAHLIARTP
jgi:hypothetical protein